jgi:hypothetical protein
MQPGNVRAADGKTEAGLELELGFINLHCFEFLELERCRMYKPRMNVCDV